MVYKKAPGKIARQHGLSDIIWRAFGAAGIPAVKEPYGLDRQDEKRPDGLANLNPLAGWTFAGLGCDSCQPVSCFLRRQSSHRRWRSGRYGSFQEDREILISIFSVHA